MAANYDNSAWFYDRLSRVVYGETLVTAQTKFLQLIRANATVLIAGGGTGEIVEAITRVHPAGLTIVYVELSEKMIAYAQRRNFGQNTITFINNGVEEADLQPKFDVVITPFLLDSLSPSELDKVFNSIDKVLLPSGIWINTDFQLTGKWWQNVLLKTMLLFFKLIGCIEVLQLPFIKQSFAQRAYKVEHEQTFFGDFIVSTVYSK
jgi:ubiquinone/menaquinone biosynthesis C-methylase UbiE